ncbi:MAG: NAD-dependent epimerase/dehydratase family protein [Bacteroidetes bacterium]|jgi:nucleoside-diphosphate-sugar epimerase|nr:NAD-dependent epimerase/dehydratase family protein [Bacteroidota bacterium]
MQTILGAGGAIGIELAKSLTEFTDQIRLVSRSPEKVNQSDELFAADLTDSEQTLTAVEGSEIVYLTVGLKYHHKVWQSTWPVIMDNVIRACEKSGAKLVFFDNIYLYDKSDLDPITENSKVNPPSKKGAVRAQIAETLWKAVDDERIEALIARSADFYGPGITKPLSILIETVFKPLHQGKKASLLCSDSKKHSFTYTPDAGKATAMLGNTPDAYGEVWHLPTASDPCDGKGWVELVAREMNTDPSYRVVPKWMVWMMGLFMPVMRESVEMLYQYDRDYIFDSSKFENRFDLKPTSYPQAVKEVIESDFK